jgi:predicted DNA-binding transcriptional regulator AlpA
MQQTLLRIADVAQMLGVSASTIDNWARTAGFPPGRRLGGPRSRKIWLEADLHAWINRPADKVPANVSAEKIDEREAQ